MASAAYVQLTGRTGAVTGTAQYVSTNAGKSWRRSNILGG